MSTFQYASTSTFSEELSTPNGGANVPKSSGWTSSTGDNERSAKRHSSVGHQEVPFKHRKTPSTTVTINNEHVSSSGQPFSGTECDRDRGEGMNENDIVHQRNLASIQDGSPAESEVKVANKFSA